MEDLDWRNFDLLVLFFIFYFLFTSTEADVHFDDQCPHSLLGRHRSAAEVSYRANGKIEVNVRLQVLVEEAAQCVECRLLLQAVYNFKPSWISADKGGKWMSVEKWSTYTVKLFSRRLSIGSFQMLHRSKDEPFYESEDPNPESTDILRRPRAQAFEVSSDSSSKAALYRASQWLSHCLEHDGACELPNTDFMPKLLIDVGSEDDAIEPFLYKPTEVTPYACLSYCWEPDTKGILRTTAENLEAHYESIPWSKMPLGIKDAIMVCRGLKVRSLWVDSLCIIHDDSVDWHGDPAELNRIYLYSRLSIAALEPATCKSRFLGPQKFAHPTWQSRFTADTPRNPKEPPLEIFVRPCTEQTAEYKKGLSRSSLDKRGWSLQESLLPARRLCFNGNEMMWQCLCRTICECGHILWKPQPSGFGRLGTHLKSKRLKADVVLSDPQPAWQSWHQSDRYDYRRSGPGYSQNPYKRWRDIVVEYTKRGLILRKDKLNAVSGLAMLARESLPDNPQDQGYGHPEEYLAGLWRGEFHYDLAWMVKSPIAEQGIAEKSSIPSWSWASVNAPVTYKFDDPVETWKHTPYLIERVKVESVICLREVANDESSNVVSGEAILTGLVSHVKLAVMLDSGGMAKTYVRSANLRSYKVKLDRPRSLTILSGERQSDCWMRGTCQHGDDCCKWTVEEHDERLICLVLFTWVAPVNKKDYYGNPRPNMGPETWFLVLKPSTSVDGAFERIGIGHHAHWEIEKCKLFEDEELATVKIV
ncbi:heterokaryon incompatibility protein domain-containing protein [Trichoderma afarasin]